MSKIPMEILVELRQRFRDENPHLHLPPAKKMSKEEIEKKTEQILIDEEIRLKKEYIETAARQSPSTVAGKLRNYINQEQQHKKR